MPLPTLEQNTAASAYEVIRAEASSLLVLVGAVRADLGSDMRVMRLIDLHTRLRAGRSNGEQLAAAPGIADFAKQAMGDPAYDLFANWGAAVQSGIAVNVWIEANVPNDGAGGAVLYRFTEGAVAQPTFLAPSSLAPLAPLLDALISAIQG